MTDRESRPEGEATGGGIEEKVSRVRHLEAFDYSSRDDGRFSLRLLKPPAEMEEEERETLVRLLTRLAGKIGEC